MAQATSHVGAAGVGMVSLKGAPVSMPSIATAEFQRYWEMGRALHGIFPASSGSIANIFGFFGFSRR